VAVRNPLDAFAESHPLSSEREGAEAAEGILGHRFAKPSLLREALTHRSAALVARGGRQKGAGSNERLEFVGDRVLGLLVAEWLIERYPDEQEGALGPRLAQLVSQPVIATIAEAAGLSATLTVGSSESKVGVRRKATVLADAVEALIGALYLDAGLEPARRFVRRAWEAAMTAQVAPPKDAKTALQEWALGRGKPLPTYQVVSREGPPHAPVFAISVTVDGRSATGTAGAKREAEQAAAETLLKELTI